MKKNLAHWDRALHLAIGLFFVLLTYSFHWGFFIVAAYFLIVSALSYSPVYDLLKMSTIKKK